LLRLLNELLQFEVKDPRLIDVRVSDVELSADLGVAKVYYSTLQPDADTAPVDAAFASAASFMRTRVARALQLRRVPELRFCADESVKRAMDLTRLIEQQAADSAPEE